MKKAIVLGATGQLGCYSALALKENGYDVIAVGRRISDGGFFASRDIKFIGGFDISKSESFDLLPDEYFDAVVNMAGTMPAHADMNMMPYVQSIVVGTVNLCEWMKRNGSKRIIFNTTPSDVVDYWGTTEPIDDDAVRSFPKNGNDHAVYAICKRAATDILEHMKIADGFEPCVFRHFMEILLLSLSKLNFFTFWEAYDSSAPNKQINQESCNQSNNKGSAAKLP